MSNLSKTRLEKLKTQRDKLNNLIQKQEARLKLNERKIETRKKILIGSYYLDKAIKENKTDEVKLLMDNYLKRNSDRLLFDLEPLPES